MPTPKNAAVPSTGAILAGPLVREAAINLVCQSAQTILLEAGDGYRVIPARGIGNNKLRKPGGERQYGSYDEQNHSRYDATADCRKAAEEEDDADYETQHAEVGADPHVADVFKRLVNIILANRDDAEESVRVFADKTLVCQDDLSVKPGEYYIRRERFLGYLMLAFRHSYVSHNPPSRTRSY